MQHIYNRLRALTCAAQIQQVTNPYEGGRDYRLRALTRERETTGYELLHTDNRLRARACSTNSECFSAAAHGAGPARETTGHAKDNRLIDSCITQLKAQGPSRTCNESKKEEEQQVTSPYLDNRLRALTYTTGYDPLLRQQVTSPYSDNMLRALT